MADQYTANYGWTKPDVGASDDTWGDKFNTNLDAIDAEVRSIADVRGIEEAPMDQQPYARDMGAWVVIPQIIPDAPTDSTRYGRFNRTWQPDAIQTDAPSDGGTYGRQNAAWNAALALTGGTITGSLTVNQVLTVQGSNSMVLTAPGGNQRAILGQTLGLTRWQLQLGDITAEGLNNAGSNFSLSAYSNTGAFLGNWLTIARADGSTVFNGGVNMNQGLAVNGLLAVNSIGNFYLPGGANGQVLSTNGSGVLSWATRLTDAPNDGQYYARQNQAWAVAPGGMTDAPNDGTAYARKSLGWAHLTHTDITDWTATLAPYALTANVPVASSTTPLMDGTAAVGTGTTWARADHVHPTDTSRYAASNPNGYQTAAQVTAVLPVASTTTPLADGIAAIGVGTTYARADHVHPITAMGDNRLINGNFAINQRGYVSGTALPASPTVANGYGHDRWKAGAGGCTYTFTTALPDTTITITANTLTQIIEAGMIEGGVYTLSWTGTAQARVYQGTPTGAYAASPITTASLPAGVNTIVEFNAGTVTRVKLEIGSVATPFNRQSLAKSLADCQRYYFAGYFDGGGYSAAAGGSLRWSWALPVTMRASPTVTPTFTTNTNVTTPSMQPVIGAALDAVSVGGGATAIGNWRLTGSYTASVEL